MADATEQDQPSGLAEAVAPFGTIEGAEADRAPATPTRVVCLGASAGGLEALEQFFDAMPATSGMAFVIVQHLSPDFRSLMDELLARRTPMRIATAQDGMRLVANAVYLAPPRRKLGIAAGRLVLAEADSAPAARRMPIDAFMRALAADQGAGAVGIILSGTGSDGARGVAAIAAAGGRVLLQDPATARFDGMPRSAMAVLPGAPVVVPGRMPELLVGPLDRALVATAEGPLPGRPLDPRRRILDLLRRRFGPDFSLYKMAAVGRRIHRRARLHQQDSLADYADLVERNGGELDALYTDLLIGVTAFFRDAPAFAALERGVVAPLLAAPRADRPIRVWVAGCATGEEAYSIAMLFAERAAAQGVELQLQVFATDIHRRSLELAAQGIYPAESVRALPPGLLERHFDALGERFQIKPALRRHVVFSQHNLVEDPPFTRLDLVSCRNLLIYLGDVAQRRVLALFHGALAEDGWLLLGPSETLGELAGSFRSIDPRWRLFARAAAAPRPVGATVAPAIATPAAGPEWPAPPVPGGQDQRHLLPAYDRLLGRYAPPSLLIGAGGELLHVFGDAKRFLRLAEGLFSRSLLELVDDALRPVLASTLERALRHGEPVTGKPVVLRDAQGGGELRVVVGVEPLNDRRSRATHLLVTFASSTSVPSQAAPPSAAAADLSQVVDPSALHERIADLERDLMFTEESLQSTIEELETANEELRSTNQELMAANQELQSTNEELHAVNEELYTVSAEHQRKIDALTRLSSDMDNLLRSTAIGTIFVDPALCVRRYTPAAAAIFNLVPHDRGRPLAHVTFRFADDRLHADLRAVLQGGAPVEREVEVEGGCVFLMRLQPCLDGADSIEGVVLTFVDVTALRRAEEEARRLEMVLADGRRRAAEGERDRLFAFFVQAPAMIAVHEGPEHRFLLSNPAYDAAIGGAACVGQPLAQVLPEIAQQGALELYDRVLRSGQPAMLPELTLRAGDAAAADGRVLTQLLQPFRDADGTVTGVMSLAYDITEVRRTRRESEALLARLQAQQASLELAFAIGGMSCFSIDLAAGHIAGGPLIERLLGSAGAITLDALLERLDEPSAGRLRSILAEPDDAAAVDLELTLADADELAAFRLVGHKTAAPGAVLSGVAVDLTERRRAEELLRRRAADLAAANRQLEQFTHLVSHDLKSPLRGVHHLASFLRDDLGASAPAPVLEHLDKLDRQVGKMSRMLDDLQSYAHQDRKAGQRTETVDLEALAVELGELVGRPAGFTLTVDARPARIVTDRAALSVVLRNLIDNSLKHHDSPSGAIRLEAAPDGKGRQRFRLVDDGPGIARRHRKRVFELFHRLAGAGSGMGLAFVKRTVERQGGRLWIEDAPAPVGPARGVAFCFTWPLDGRGKVDD